MSKRRSKSEVTKFNLRECAVIILVATLTHHPHQQLIHPDAQSCRHLLCTALRPIDALWHANATIPGRVCPSPLRHHGESSGPSSCRIQWCVPRGNSPRPCSASWTATAAVSSPANDDSSRFSCRCAAEEEVLQLLRRIRREDEEVRMKGGILLL